MMGIAKRAFIYFLLLLLSVMACRPTADIDSAAVRETVTTYCRRLEASYAAMNAGELAELVSPAHLDRLNHRFEALSRAGRQMEARLKSIEFIEIDYAKISSVTVKTREVWHVRHRDTKDGRLIKEHPDFAYRMSYTLEKKDGKWIVSSGDIVEEVE